MKKLSSKANKNKPGVLDQRKTTLQAQSSNFVKNLGKPVCETPKFNPELGFKASGLLKLEQQKSSSENQRPPSAQDDKVRVNLSERPEFSQVHQDG